MPHAPTGIVTAATNAKVRAARCAAEPGTAAATTASNGMRKAAEERVRYATAVHEPIAAHCPGPACAMPLSTSSSNATSVIIIASGSDQIPVEVHNNVGITAQMIAAMSAVRASATVARARRRTARTTDMLTASTHATPTNGDDP